MRLPGTRIWRAFPELDRFSDQQCAAFVKAARRQWKWRLVRVGVMIVSIPIALSAAAIVLIWTSNLVENGRAASGLATAASIVGGIVGLLLLPAVLLGALVIRDRLLRWRIRYAIFNRGTCIGCHYMLIGLPVSEKTTVVCPECGIETQVDPALGELAVGEDGGRVLRPVDESRLPRARRRFWTARRLKRTGAVLLTLVVIGLLGKVGFWFEEKLRLEAQAKRAAAERNGAAALGELVEKAQPAESEGKPDGWALLSKAVWAAKAVDNKVWLGGNGPTYADGTTAMPEYSWFRNEPDPDYREKAAVEAALARTMLSELAAAGVFDDLKQLAGFQRAMWSFGGPDGPPVMTQPMTDLMGARTLAKINAGRMGLAMQNEDLPEFAAALEANLAIGRLLHMHPLLISDLVAMAIESLTHDCVLSVLLRHPSQEWVDAIESAYRRGEPTTARDFHVRGEREAMLDSIAWFFSDANRVKDWRTTAATFLGMSGSVESEGSRIGTYEENRDATNAMMDRLQAHVTTERWQRSGGTLGGTEADGLVLVESSMIWRFATSVDIETLNRRGMRTMLALERFRLREGKYPENLGALVPKDLKELPLDPWSGRSLGYRLLLEADSQGRGYLLYSVGGDGVDDGGKVASTDQQKWGMLTKQATPGFDHIINDR